MYRYHPWDEGDDVVDGRSAIVAELARGPGRARLLDCRVPPLGVDGDRAVAVGVSRYLAADGALEREYHNVFLCRFDDEGRCPSSPSSSCDRRVAAASRARARARGRRRSRPA